MHPLWPLHRCVPDLPQPVAARRPRSRAVLRGNGRTASRRLHALRFVRLCLSVKHSALPAVSGEQSRAPARAGAGRMSADKLIVTASPHIRSLDSTPRIMWHVVASLIPVVLCAAWFFGVSALLQVTTAITVALLTERATGKGGAIADGSATITGLLLGLSLPAGFPLWMTALGAAFAIVFGKQVWGGLG